jgi:aminobenzoyl-glutamate utilization protein B
MCKVNLSISLCWWRLVTRCLLAVLALFATPVIAGDRAGMLTAMSARDDAMWAAAQQIWEWAEPGYQEERSAALLSGMLEQAGFRVERGVGGIPTAFTAEFGEGAPVLAILGEYDALPGLAQAAVPTQQPVPGNGYGHGCGHHLFGVASASAAMALADEIRAGTFPGTVRYYGCPAEEGGSAKAFLVRAGLFNDVAVALHWHPGDRNTAGDQSTLARIAVKYRFHGRSSHAAAAPEQGRSALDAVELMNHAAELLREHTPEGTRIHHVITSGGEAPNIVPAFAEVYYYVRHPESAEVNQLHTRLRLCAEGAALATETKLEVREEGGIVEILPNAVLSQVALANLRELVNLEYNAEETDFALRLQTTLLEPKPLTQIHDVEDESGTVGQGSTDVGDVSWVVPTTGISTSCWVPGTPYHSWQAVACGNTTIARQGMLLAARVLAATGYDLLSQPQVIAEAQAEHQRRRGDKGYQPLIGADQLPPLDYRKPPSSQTVP